MPTSQYTPFLADIGATLGRGLEKRGLKQQEDDKNKLIQSAYMEQPGALQQLYGVDPQAAAQVESQKRQKKQDVLQTKKLEGSEEDRTKKIFLENKELVDKTLKEATKLGTMEEGQAYVDRVIQQNQEIFKDANITPFTPESWEQVKTVYAKQDGKGGVSQVQSSSQLPGGFVQIVRKDGTVELVEPKEAEAELIRGAEERGAELQGLRAAERESGKGAMKESIAAFKQLTPLRKNISNYNEAIKLIGEGAETGVIAAKFPSMTEASIKLDNLQAQLGLDVISNTTFGALSESELAFALASAIPLKLEGPALVKWLEQKRDAQAKLIDYLNEAAIFLGTPGNSVAGYLQQQKESQGQSANKVDTPESAQKPDLTPEEQSELEQLRKRLGR